MSILVYFATFLWGHSKYLTQCASSFFQETKTNTCFAAGFLSLYSTSAAFFRLSVMWSWFIRGRGPWAAISPFPSALWLPDNIQLSLMCRHGLTARLSAYSLLRQKQTHICPTRAPTHTNEIEQCLSQFRRGMTSAIKIYEYEKIECDVTAFWKNKNWKKKQRSTNSMKLTDYCHSDEKDRWDNTSSKSVQ